MHKYPEATEVTAEVAVAALKAHGDVVDKSTECSELWQALAVAARAAAESPEPDWPSVKALWLVADACSMMLDGDSTNEPFGPLAVFNEGRSAVPGDFRPEDLALFSAVSDRVEHRALRARLADLAWVGARPKNVEDARRAIDAYVAEVPSENTWVTALRGWRRAATLCMQLRKGADGRLEKIEQDLERIAETALKLDGGLGRAAAKLLFDRHLAINAGTKLSELLGKQGESMLVSSSDFWHARAYLDLAGQWFSRLGDPERAADMTVKIAQSFEAEADHRIALDPNAGHLVARSFLEDAIQTLRKVPKDQRPARGVEEQLLRLSRRITESGEKAVKSMPTIRTGTTDITEIVEQSVRAVSGKEPLQALLELARLHPGANLARMTQFAEESLREFAFSRLFGATHISRDGRVVAKTPGGSLDETSEVHKAKVFSKVMQHYGIDISLVCQGRACPNFRV